MAYPSPLKHESSRDSRDGSHSELNVRVENEQFSLLLPEEELFKRNMHY